MSVFKSLGKIALLMLLFCFLSTSMAISNNTSNADNNNITVKNPNIKNSTLIYHNVSSNDILSKAVPANAGDGDSNTFTWGKDKDGYPITWYIKSGGPLNPGNNYWSMQNAWVDYSTNPDGDLHLRISNVGNDWSCAEIWTADPLGPGMYQFWVDGPIDKLDQNVVLGLFNYPTPDIGPDRTNEIDIEMARWGYPANPNGNYGVWPNVLNGPKYTKTYPFTLTGTQSTQRFVWRNDDITFQSLNGFRDWNDNSNEIKNSGGQDTYINYIPQNPLPLHINLWLVNSSSPPYNYLPPHDQKPVEIVVKKFSHFPLWYSVGGYIKSDPFAISDDGGYSHILAVGGDDALWDYVSRFSSTGMWRKLGGILNSNPCAARRPIPGGNIHVFARGADNGLWDCESSTWHNLNGIIASDPSATGDPNQPDHLSIAVKGSDNALWINDLNTNSIAGIWNGLGGYLTSNPKVIFDRQVRRHTFVRGGDGALWDSVGVWTGNRYQNKWYSLGGIITSDPKPIIRYDTPNNIYIFVRGADGALWEKILDTSTETGQWISFGGILSATREAPIHNMESPEPSVDGLNNIHVYVKGQDGAIWECVVPVSGGYQWNYIGGVITSNPVAAGNAVAVRGGDGGLWINQ